MYCGSHIQISLRKIIKLVQIMAGIKSFLISYETSLVNGKKIFTKTVEKYQLQFFFKITTEEFPINKE